MFVLLLSLIAATAISATEIPYKSFSNVTIVALGKSKNETGGEGHVAAAGILPPFGSIGVGCGVNWNTEKEGYGAFGLGGGYSITNETMSIGAGIGINPSNSSADFNFMGSTNGTFELRFKSTEDFA
ncbi:hypothetical protein HII31_03866, partial [Pseudocercospora fuligena]